MPYIVWKQDMNSIGQESWIQIRRVNPDGITFDPNEKTTVIMRANTPDDQLIVEGPWLIFRNGYYYLFFSADGMTRWLKKVLSFVQ